MTVGPNQMPETIAVPVPVWEDVLARLDALEARADKVDQPAAASNGAEVELPRRSLARFAAGVVRPNLQIYSEAGGDATTPVGQRVEELAAKAELASALHALVRPYQLAFESILGNRAEVVKKKLPEKPAPDAPHEYYYSSAYEQYIAKNRKVLSWSEILPTAPGHHATYTIQYLPAQTKVKGSKPEMVSFSATTPLTVVSIKDCTPKSQTIECKLTDGIPQSVTLNEESFTRLQPGMIQGWNRMTSVVLQQDSIGRTHYVRTSDGRQVTEYMRSHASYDERRQLLTVQDKPELTLTPEELIESVAGILSKIPTL